MSEARAASSPPAETPQPTSPVRRAQSPWPRRLMLAVAGAATLFLLYLLLSALLPRWWAQRTGDVVAERFTVGTFYGLFVGFTFTVLPLVALGYAVRRRASWRARFVLLGVAVLFAVPNLLTLSVVLGSGNAAHAGEQIMDAQAPAFRGASLAGALIAVVGIALTAVLLASRRRTRRQLGSLRDQLRERDAAQQPAAGQPAAAQPPLSQSSSE